MIDDRYYIKIVPHRGDAVHRFVVRKRDVAIAGVLVLLVLTGALVFAGLQVARAGQERAVLSRIAGQTESLHRQLQRVQRENQQITQLIGVPPPRHRARKRAHVSWTQGPQSLKSLEQHVAVLSAESVALVDTSETNKNLVLRVLNLRHIRAITRERLLAFIPSIDPVDGAPVIGCFCYRTYPDVEFHKGVDLEANYGEPVRASAAGTVVAAVWDGGYGMKVDIDHGNGYHTWYAHLSHIGVSVGQRVYKGEEIALVGATGFATGPHLHYQVMLDGQAINPAPYLHGIPSSVLASLR
jgi:hypothetical protein